MPETYDGFVNAGRERVKRVARTARVIGAAFIVVAAILAGFALRARLAIGMPLPFGIWHAVAWYLLPGVLLLLLAGPAAGGATWAAYGILAVAFAELLQVSLAMLLFRLGSWAPEWMFAAYGADRLIRLSCLYLAFLCYAALQDVREIGWQRRRHRGARGFEPILHGPIPTAAKSPTPVQPRAAQKD